MQIHMMESSSVGNASPKYDILNKSTTSEIVIANDQPCLVQIGGVGVLENHIGLHLVPDNFGSCHDSSTSSIAELPWATHVQRICCTSRKYVQI
mmetsp:Transcript_40669/g.121296  ORF Transcript_40669/g.121296 Transcript_40669/m.121296 type:complete len:94 (-) Transcript_40669:1095-1376(-)